MTKEQTNCDCKYPLGCGICKDLPPRPKTTRDQVYDILKSSKMLSDSLDEIDVFISKLISQEKEKWVEEIKKGLLNCPKTDWGDTDEETPDSWEEGYEQCLQDTLDFVNNLLQKQ